MPHNAAHRPMRTQRIASLAGLLLAAALAWSAPTASAQDRNGFTIPDDATSENNEMLERILQTFPESDANNDGILDAQEARAELERRRREWDRAREERQNNSGRRSRFNGEVHADIAYGPSEANQLNIYTPREDSVEGPTPLVVFFHGGDFITGSRNDTGSLSVRDLVARGIAVASVDYRLAREDPFPASFNDAAAALQFLRYHADRYNIDPARVALHGEDAGANLALFLALHDDMAVENESTEEGDAEKPAEINKDEPPSWTEPGIATMSTRVLGAVARHPLASYDPRYWQANGLPLNQHERKLPLYLDTPYLDPFTEPELIDLVADISPVDLASANDPPLLLFSQFPELEINEKTSWTIMAHHPRQLQLIQQAMKSAGAKSIIRYRDMENDPGTSGTDFLIQLLKP